jgi:hypothetical protein
MRFCSASPAMRAFPTAIALFTLMACASAAPAPVPAEPVLDLERLCAGDAEDPKGERDPACAPARTHEPVEIEHHLAACAPGLHGPAEIRLGDQLLVRLRPGESKAMNLPRGDTTLTIVRDGASETRTFMLAGPGPLLIELGCDPRSFTGGLQPLLIEGPHDACGGGDEPVRVRAGGLNLEIGRDQVQTLLLPRGDHVVKIAGDERTVEIRDGGARVSLATPCTSGP